MRYLPLLCAMLSVMHPARLLSQAPTWSKDVAPIIYQNCTKCHNAGGLAPFTLESYDDAALRMYDIRDRVSHKIMPPWPPVASYRHFANERVLRQGQIDTIVSWVDAGVPKGNLEEAPPVPH